MDTTFFSMVIKRFQYLLSEYGFEVRKVEESKRNPQTEGRIEFESTTTFVAVSSEQWAVRVSIGRVKDDKFKFFLYPEIIYEYAVLTKPEKKLVCSFDPTEDKKAIKIVQKKRLLHKDDGSGNIINDINDQLSNYSKWLRQYAEPFLRGDFSQWLSIYEYKVRKTQAVFIRSGKDEFVLRFVRMGENGKPIHEKRSIFQASFDYLDTLQKEYQTGE